MDTSRPKLKRQISLAADAGNCLVRSTADQRRQLERLLYRRYPEAEWGTFFRFGYRITPWGIMISMVDLLTPGRADLDERSLVVEFATGYISRAMRSFDRHLFGVGVIHSHPEGCTPRPSPADDDMDGYYAAEFEKFSGGRPYASLIVSRDAAGRRRFSGRCFHRGNWMPISTWLTCGIDVLGRDQDFRAVQKPISHDSSNDRVRQLLGDAADGRLRNAVIGIVGCSGLGTPAGHVLARARIGEFVLVDKGIFKASNHERNHASRAGDLVEPSQPKVELLKRLIHEINPETAVTTVMADVLDDRAVDQLVRCDLIMGCTDSFYARAALGDLAIHYQVPVLDLAVQMGVRDGRLFEQVGEFARYLPGLPCPWCRKRVTTAAIRAETAPIEERVRAERGVAAARERGEDGAQYWIGQNRQELTIGYMTTAVGAVGAGYAQNWLTGLAPLPHDRFQFDLGLKELGVVADARKAERNCSCQRCIGFADQGSADRTVSRVHGGDALSGKSAD